MPNYLVRLPINVTADTAGNAVQAMIDELNKHGVRNWQYRVDTMNDDGTLGEFVGVFTGHGHTVGGDSSETPVTLTDDAADTELLQFADNLNDGNDTPVQ